MVTGDSKTRSGVLEAETTISSSLFSSSFKTTLIFWLAEVILTVFVVNPTADNLIVKGNFSDVVNLKEPSKSVETPVRSPSITTLTPGIGCLLRSVTEPVIVFCAKDAPQKNNIISKYTLMWVSFLVSLSSQNTNIFDINKKTLKKINITHLFC
ncbi:hypothetical protein D3C85_427070 [compost metagenome]